MQQEQRPPHRVVQRPSTARFRRGLVLDAARIIDREYRTPIELDDVAQRIYTSRRQLQRSFEEVTGMTFRGYVHAVRMERAAAHLRDDPQRTIRAVASGVGYRQQAQFAKAFRRYWGVAPGEYREAVQRGDPLPASRLTRDAPAAD